MDNKLNQAIARAIPCPCCGRGRLYTRVPRAFWAKRLLFFLPLKRYKCHHCGRKSHIWIVVPEKLEGRLS